MKDFSTKEMFNHDRKKVFEPSIDSEKNVLWEETLEEMTTAKTIRNEILGNAFVKVYKIMMK